MPRVRACAAAAAVALSILRAGAAAGGAVPLSVEAAWIREGPPVMTSLAGYMVLRNPGERPEVIRSARSPDFERIEFHLSTTVDGVARMRQQENIEVSASGRTVLEPGGLHLMLTGPGRALRAGDEVELVLSLEGGREIHVRVPVRREAPR